MNCRFARQLISPYLDGQLTGREMLALGDHLADCESCRHEMQSLKQVKSLLRGLAEPRPPLELSRRLSSQEIYTQSISSRVVNLPPRPQRGRRLMAALALSCLTLFAFAPASRDGQVVPSAGPLTSFPSPATASQEMLLPPTRPAMGPPAFALSGTSRPGLVTFASVTTFDRDFAYPPLYGPSAALFQTSRPAEKTISTRYRR